MCFKGAFSELLMAKTWLMDGRQRRAGKLMG